MSSSTNSTISIPESECRQSSDLTPRNLDEALRFAELLSKSDIVPKDYQGKPGNVLVAIQWGAEVGLSPLQAMQNIAVINGRPSLWGDALLGLVRGSGLLEFIQEEISEDGQEAVCVVKRRGEQSVQRVFTMEDAKRAGLAGKSGPWQQYPRRMLQMRARAWALRDVFPDVLKGLQVAEEAQDLPPVQQSPAALPEAKPRDRKSRVKAALAKEKPQGGEDQVHQLTDAILACETGEQLEAVAVKIRATELTDDEKEALKSAYKARKVEIERSASG